MAKKTKKETSLGIKIFVWFMFFAMFAGFLLPILSQFIQTK